MRNWFILLGFLSVLVSFGQKVQSIVYALPQTKLGVHFELEQTQYLPGPFAEYTRELIGLDQYVSKKYKEWEVLNASIEVIKELDPKHIYSIQAGEKQSIDLEKLKALTNGQIIFPIHPSSSEIQNQMVSKNLTDPFIYIPYEGVEKEHIDTIYKKEFRDSVKVDIPYYIRKYNPKNKRDFAEEAAEILLYIRERKIALLSMEEEAYEHTNASIAALEKLEQEYLSLFIGKKLTQKIQWVEYVTPNAERMNMGKFSKSVGFTSANAEGQVLAVSIVRNAKIVNVKGYKSDPASTQMNIKIRVPETVIVDVLLGSQLLVRQSIGMEQFGELIEVSGANLSN